MAAAKEIKAATIDLLLSDIATSTMVLYTSHTTNPTDAAAIGTGGTVLLKRTLTPRAGSDNADYALVSGTSLQVKQASVPIASDAAGTATCIILKTGSTNNDGVIKAITTGSTQITNPGQFTPDQFTITIPAAA